VLRVEHFWLIWSDFLFSWQLFPFQSLFLLIVELFDDSGKLQNLMVDRIHLIFILEQVVLMDVLDLEFVVLSTACLDTVAVIENL